MANNMKEHGKKVREDILNAIINYIKEHGYPPTHREIGAMVGLRSTSTVYTHLLKMKDEGMIETDDTFCAPRAIRVPGYRFVKEDNDAENKN